jgi:hypothetical protein
MTITNAASHTQPIPRTLVHRYATADVFIGDFLRFDDATFSTTAQLPRTHVYYNDHVGSHAPFDPLAALEAMRQATILFAHKVHGVAVRSACLFTQADLAVEQHEPNRGWAGLLPTEGLIDGRVAEWKLRHGDRTGYMLDMTLTTHCGRVVSARIGAQWMPASAWSKLRPKQREALNLSGATGDVAATSHRRIDPSRIARGNAQNVVIGVPLQNNACSQLSFPIIVDQTYAGLFDHELDHVPAAVMFEAARQVAIFTGERLFRRSPFAPRLAGLHASFDAIGELDLPTIISVIEAHEDIDGVQSYTLEIAQHERVLSRFSVTMGV